MDKQHFLLRYMNKHGVITDLVIPIPEDEYRSDMSYRENLSCIITDIYCDGGLWVDENTIIPYHRIICVECYKSQDQNVQKDQKVQDAPLNKNNGDRNNHFKRRHNKQNKEQWKKQNDAPPPSSSNNESTTTNIISAT